MKLYRSLLLVLAMAGSASAATVSFSILTDTAVATPTGVALDDTFTLYVGRYTGAATLPTSTVFSDIQPNFTSITSVTFATGDAAGAAGYVSLPDFNFVSATGGFANTNFAIWITNGSGLNAVVTGFGTIPSDDAVPNSFSYGIDSNNVAGLQLVLGTYDPNGSNGAGTGGNVVLNGIPEPSAALLGALGALGLLRRRRN